MARLKHSDLASIANLQKLYLWDLRINTSNPFFNGINSINYRCESVDLPQVTNQKIETMIRGHKTFSPGIQEYSGSITMNFIETVPHVISPFIYRWQQALWNDDTGISIPKADLIADVQIVLLGDDNTPQGLYELQRVFPEAADPGGTLDGASSDGLKPNVTFSFDKSIYRSL